MTSAAPPERTIDRELSVDEAVRAIAALAAPLTGHEEIAAAAARQRVLADVVRSHGDLPGYDNAAMDGYALRHADAAQPLKEVGCALAGHPFDAGIAPGACVRIMTGAAVPSGADTVVMREDTRAVDARVVIDRVPPAGANIRRRGEHIAAGAEVYAAGHRLRAVDIGLLAGLGCDRVAVRPQLRVGVLSTGDELADPPAPLPAVGGYDANRPMLRGLLEGLGFVVQDLGICGDRAADFDSALARAREAGVHALVVSGGAALGDADVVRRTGAVRFVPVAVRPGRGVAVMEVGGAASCLLLGLPGNVVAAFVLFQLVARPVLLHRAGTPLAATPHVPLRLARDVRLRGGRTDYLRARFVDDPELGHALEPLAMQSSSALRSVTEADALIACGPQPHYQRGDIVAAVLLDAIG
jgi:molybdopterin molybdotransferase